MKMTQSPTFFFIIIFSVMFLLSSFVYANEYPALTQSRITIDDSDFNNKSVKQIARQHLENVFLGASIDQYFNYDFGVDKSTGIKTYSSLRLKIRSDHTLIQLKMRF